MVALWPGAIWRTSGRWCTAWAAVTCAAPVVHRRLLPRRIDPRRLSPSQPPATRRWGRSTQPSLRRTKSGPVPPHGFVALAFDPSMTMSPSPSQSSHRTQRWARTHVGSSSDSMTGSSSPLIPRYVNPLVIYTDSFL